MPLTSIFNSPISPVQETDESWRMTVDCDKLNQVMAPIANALTGVFLFPEKSNTSPGMCYVAIKPANVFFFLFLHPCC